MFIDLVAAITRFGLGKKKSKSHSKHHSKSKGHKKHK